MCNPVAESEVYLRATVAMWPLDKLQVQLSSFNSTALHTLKVNSMYIHAVSALNNKVFK